ncbi:TonB-dependent receptor [Marinimicrobium sp. ABcell2]|uniref:TonB-dependent receptor n=1 Tax=Marinimicrobium sp. ABcell2 TaxID=3069751 RepID=UPI0027B1EB29|nr:TonB-dependent receptor [Marinimicrobium sp. ABcell2]MDQ2077780.1 TonB-dependent receptor [Marinimicrobium sp. ABcell2]
MRVPAFLVVLVIVAGGASVVKADHDFRPDRLLEEVHVWGTAQSVHEAGYNTPTSVLLPEDMQAINATTTEDLVKYEPSLVIRRRFIGDANGTLGMRGSNMFQTSRAMVFADGVPLHYLLQSRWSGAPRWTMVSASEIERVEVLYGPFSAEYSGNAMGGVVLIETGIPQKREFYAEGTFFSQQFSDYAFDDHLNGHKGFVSYGDKVGNLSYYLSYNRLENESQPQNFLGANPIPTSGASTVEGGIHGLDTRAREQLWYGDSGSVNTSTDNVKFKLAYDFGQWQTLFNAAFEDRRSSALPNSYITDAQGNTVWSGNDLLQDGYRFSFDSSNLSESKLNRDTLSLGLRLKGALTERVRLETNLNHFDILKDVERTSLFHLEDANHTSEGQISAYDDSGWQTAEIKMTVQDLGLEGLELVSGVRHESYRLNLDVYDSPDYLAYERGAFRSRFGGQTEINALFSQANWAISRQWDASFGLRYEEFQSRDGYYSEYNTTTQELDLVTAPRSDDAKLSPKLSVGYRPADSWLVRYSVARAYRFPIVEELFRQYQAYNRINEANPDLEAEKGLHHNLMFDKTISGGYLRLNLFQETVKNAIESQSTTIVGGPNDGVSVNTFVPLDETQVHGIEFIANQYGMFLSNLDVRFNVAYTHAEITENASNPDWEGNRYPRMPKWRTNLLATYHLTEDWNAGISLQYASNSYGRIQNDDTIRDVYGAQDAYTRIGLRTNYTLTDNLRASFGVDNVTNEITYVAHPWPGRTLYLSLAYRL